MTAHTTFFHSLRTQVTNVKDRTGKLMTCGVAYHIQCEQCPDNCMILQPSSGTAGQQVTTSTDTSKYYPSKITPSSAASRRPLLSNKKSLRVVWNGTRDWTYWQVTIICRGYVTTFVLRNLTLHKTDKFRATRTKNCFCFSSQILLRGFAVVSFFEGVNFIREDLIFKNCRKIRQVSKNYVKLDPSKTKWNLLKLRFKNYGQKRVHSSVQIP